MNTAPTTNTPALPSVGGQRIRDLNPGWFASVMGTGILAVSTYSNPGGVAALAGIARALGTVLALADYLLAGVLLVAFAIRWAAYRQAALADFRHPVRGAMHATLPGGLLVLAVMTSVVGPGIFAPGVTAWLLGVFSVAGGALSLLIAVAFILALVTGDQPPAAVNGGWFIPPVVTIIVPSAIAPLIGLAGPDVANLLLVVGYAFYGMGFLLFLVILGLVFDRLIFHPLPAAALAPTLWIGLGPVGVGSLAIVALAKAGAPQWPQVADVISLVSLLAGTGTWGFGLFWLALAATLLVKYLRSDGVPFHLGWWAFVFPLGAYTTATITLARAWQSPGFEGLAVLLYAGLLFAWITVAARTVAGLRTGRVWAS